MIFENFSSSNNFLFNISLLMKREFLHLPFFHETFDVWAVNILFNMNGMFVLIHGQETTSSIRILFHHNDSQSNQKQRRIWYHEDQTLKICFTIWKSFKTGSSFRSRLRSRWFLWDFYEIFKQYWNCAYWLLSSTLSVVV